MLYVYSALLLHSAGKKVTEENITKVVNAAGIKPDNARVKTLVASLKEVNIDEAISKAAIAQPPAAAIEKKEEKPVEEKKPEEESKKSEEEAAEGLSSLFG